MKVQRFSNMDEWVKASVDFIAKNCRRSDDSIIRIALSGGDTPAPVYRAVSLMKEIPFENVEIYQVDERYVPHENPDSNYKLLHETLIASLSHRLKGFYYFDTALSIEGSLARYEALLQGIDHFDLMVLGMGPDGHIASLFPASDALFEKERPVAHSVTPDFAVRDRLTLTLPPILRSRALMILLSGKEKEPALEHLLHGDENEAKFPAHALRNHDNLEIHYLES